MKKKLLGILFALVLCALVFPAAGMASTQLAGGDEDHATSITSVNDDVELTGGYYQVTGNQAIGTETSPHNITLNGDTYLILNDGCTLTVTNNNGSGIKGDFNLTVQGNGKLVINTSKTGIGCSNLTVDSSTITSTSTSGGGIHCTTLTIMNNGTITAESQSAGDEDDAISCNTFIMKRGKVKATGGNSHGIFCEQNSSIEGAEGAFSMEDGTIEASAGGTREAIVCESFTMSDGTLTADGVTNGIKCANTFTMSGGTITATATNTGTGGAYGIGCNVFTMSGGTLTADSSTGTGISCDSFGFDFEGIKNGKINAIFKGSQAAVQIPFKVEGFHDFQAAKDYLVAKASVNYSDDMKEIDLMQLKTTTEGSGPYFLSIDGTKALKQFSLEPKTTEPEPETPQSGSNNPATGIVSTNATLPAVVVLTVLAVSLTALLIINRKKSC